MTSKEKILKNIKENNLVKDAKLPSYENFGVKFEDKFETFSKMIESVGGKALLISKEDLDKTIKNIDLAVVKGNFAVAENGAIWMKNENNRHRALYFIAQNIVIVINEDEIVNNMHEAYEKLSFEKAGFGVFISGPSKTADIEQSLVIGAHGPKSGYVIFIKS